MVIHARKTLEDLPQRLDRIDRVLVDVVETYPTMVDFSGGPAGGDRGGSPTADATRHRLNAGRGVRGLFFDDFDTARPIDRDASVSHSDVHNGEEAQPGHAQQEQTGKQRGRQTKQNNAGQQESKGRRTGGRLTEQAGQSGAKNQGGESEAQDYNAGQKGQDDQGNPGKPNAGSQNATGKTRAEQRRAVVES